MNLFSFADGYDMIEDDDDDDDDAFDRGTKEKRRYNDTDADDNDDEDDEVNEFMEFLDDEDDDEWEIHVRVVPLVDDDDDSSIDPLAEKLFRLCITFLTQRFRRGDDPHSPILHFSAILGLDVKNDGFYNAGNYTPKLAGLLWIGRLLLLEYALPKRVYMTLGWSNRMAYDDHGERMEDIRRRHLVEVSYSPMSHIGALMALGKVIAKTEGRPGILTWDERKETLQIKKLSLTMTVFKKLMHSLVGSAEDLLRDELMFGVRPPSVDLKQLVDCMTEKKTGESLLTDPKNNLNEGFTYMVNLVGQVSLYVRV
jgi:hypothetical protein